MHSTTPTTRHSHTVTLLIALAVLGLATARPAGAQTHPAASPTTASVESPQRPDHPSIDFGNGTRLDIRARVQSLVVVRDDTSSAEGFSAGDERLTFDRARVGLTGVVAGRVEFQFEREVRAQQSWRDVYVDVRLARAFRVRGGQFKVPFSREQLTSVYDLDFTSRSAAVDDLVPLRGVGIMAHGVVADRALRYQAGLFEADRSTRVWQANAPRLVAGRVTVAPLKDGRHRGSDTLQVSAAWLQNPVADGRNGPEGHLVMGDRFFDRMYASGRRTMVGGGAVWSIPVVTAAGEVLRSAYARDGQAISGGNLSDLVATGGYGSAAWHFVRGKGRRRGRAPLRALDATARYDWVSFGSASTVGPAMRNPRADHVPMLAKRTWTWGSTWRVNRWVTVHTNIMRERLSDPSGLYVVTRTPVWSAVVRSQVTM